ncbi:MAG: hypothetical protein KAQ98_02795 [Bacteriovoracaceae bacterium]|nr:hypothetical protein [Bacteriovoracaceae bacterium]
MLNHFYQKLTLKKFKVYSTVFCLLGDFSILGYIYNKFADIELYKYYMNMALIWRTGTSISEYEDTTVREVFELWMNWLFGSILLIICAHLLIYIFYLKDKKTCRAYVHILGIMGALASVTIWVNELGTNIYHSWFLLQTILYLFVFMGFFTYRWYGEISSQCIPESFKKSEE